MTRQTRTSVDPAASITWVVLCESIFRDQNNRMSLLGVASDLPVPSLPLVLAEHLVVARVSRTPEPQELDVMFGVVTPAGLWVTPIDEAATVAVSGDFRLSGCGPCRCATRASIASRSRLGMVHPHRSKCRCGSARRGATTFRFTERRHDLRHRVSRRPAHHREPLHPAGPAICFCARRAAVSPQRTAAAPRHGARRLRWSAAWPLSPASGLSAPIRSAAGSRSWSSRSSARRS